VRSRTIFSALLLILYYTLACAGDFNADSVGDALERAKAYESKIELPDIHNSGAQKAAEQTAQQFYSPQYQKKIQAEIERLKSGQFADALRGFKGADQEESRNSVLPLDERLYIFISSSVPLSTLRTYASELDKLEDSGISMVMRGFVHGMKHFEPTLKLVRSILVKDSSCDLSAEKCEVYNAVVSIDPVTFRKYGVERVPAIAYVRGLGLEDIAMSEGDSENLKGSQDAYIIYGDVSVERALETIAKETASEGVDNLTKKLKKGFYAD
jgi:conjugal transfer pilus assembly protein TrbC